MTAAARRLAVLRDGSAGEPLVRWLARAGLTVVDAPAPDDVPDADAVLVLGPSAQAPLLAAAERRTPVLLVGPERVTNADHTRVLLHFADGVEAEFTASDLAAARKPTFYVLGTHGGLVGGSRRTIAVMQPATASAGDGGRPVEPPA